MNDLNEKEKKIGAVLGNIITFTLLAAIICAGICSVAGCVSLGDMGRELWDFTLMLTLFYAVTMLVSRFLVKYHGRFKTVNIINLALSAFLLVVLFAVTIVAYTISFV